MTAEIRAVACVSDRLEERVRKALFSYSLFGKDWCRGDPVSREVGGIVIREPEVVTSLPSIFKFLCAPENWRVTF